LAIQAANCTSNRAERKSNNTNGSIDHLPFCHLLDFFSVSKQIYPFFSDFFLTIYLFIFIVGQRAGGNQHVGLIKSGKCLEKSPSASFFFLAPGK